MFCSESPNRGVASTNAKLTAYLARMSGPSSFVMKGGRPLSATVVLQCVTRMYTLKNITVRMIVLSTAGIASIGAEPKFPGLLDRHGEDAEERATRRACAWPWVETSLLGRATMAAALVVLRRNVVQVRRATVGACVDVHVSSRREG